MNETHQPKATGRQRVDIKLEMQIACIHLQRYKMKGKQVLHSTKDGEILKARNDQQWKHIHDDHESLVASELASGKCEKSRVETRGKSSRRSYRPPKKVKKSRNNHRCKSRTLITIVNPQ